MSDETLQREIEAAIQRIYRSYLQFDPAGIEQGDAEDCTLWDLWTPQLIRGAAERAAFRADDMAASRQRGPLTIEIEPPLVTRHQDVAVARYYLNFAFQPPDATSGRVRVTSVFERTPSGWRRVHHHEGIVPTGRPPLREPPERGGKRETGQLG
ncbi:MAG: nuclear transport factor 2 family protein [Chloroflexi bacterium]|jgi:ketosteroid isomerase-like protein|nr:nuclear transport factor 2 family protein [Chloroflexota bacterium]